jgi:hypothetical protein
MAQVTSLDLVRREFGRDSPNQLWMTDITEHPTREGKVYCCVVLDAFSRLVVGWAVESTQTTVLVTNALGMATSRGDRADGLVIHSDRGVQFTSWAFSRKVRDAGLAPSMGAVGSAYDNAMVESFWGRMQVELFNRRRWKTRVELANAIHDYIELFHNTRQRHSALGMLTPDRIRGSTQRNPTSRLTPEPRLQKSGGRSVCWGNKWGNTPHRFQRIPADLDLANRAPRSPAGPRFGLIIGPSLWGTRGSQACL